MELNIQTAELALREASESNDFLETADSNTLF